jgi:hypothetical protein
VSACCGKARDHFITAQIQRRDDAITCTRNPEERFAPSRACFNQPAAPVTEKPAVINLFNQELYDNVQRLGLTVDRIVPVHLPADGRKVAWSELQLAAGK